MSGPGLGVTAPTSSAPPPGATSSGGLSASAPPQQQPPQQPQQQQQQQSADPVGRLRAEIHDIEKQLQRAIEKRETLKLMISQIELEEHDLALKLKNKKVELRRLASPKDPSASAPSSSSAAAAATLLPAPAHARGVVGSVGDWMGLCDALPALGVAPLVDGVNTPVRRAAGPDGADGAADAVDALVAARSVSTYPLVAGSAGGKRQGNPICDRYVVEVTNGRYVFALADGCNWGERSLDAARKATRSFVAHVSLTHGKLTVARDAGPMLLEAMAHAHNEIVAGKNDLWEAGTTTLIGGILFPLAQTRERRALSITTSSPNIIPPPPPPPPPPIVLPTTESADGSSPAEGSGRGRKGSKHSSGRHSPLPTASRSRGNSVAAASPKLREFGVCMLSIGDCKCFVYDPRTKKARDVTAGNRGNLTDVTDPGGRLGPYLDGGLPDTRNLALIFAKCHQDDLIILCSDGVHDNLDPSSLGIEPEELSPEFKGMTWDQAGAANRELAESSKALYAETRLETLIGEQLEQRLRAASPDPSVPPPAPTLMDIANQIIDYAQRTTFNGREFMENNPSKKLPKDYKLYPGKMDHTTVIVIRVDYPIDPEDQHTSIEATV